MPIAFSCPECDHAIKAPDTTAGRKVKCPSCKAVITVPQTSVSAEAPSRPSAAVKKAPPPRPAPMSREDEDDRPRGRGRPRDEEDEIDVLGGEFHGPDHLIALSQRNDLPVGPADRVVRDHAFDDTERGSQSQARAIGADCADRQDTFFATEFDVCRDRCPAGEVRRTGGRREGGQFEGGEAQHTAPVGHRSEVTAGGRSDRPDDREDGVVRPQGLASS